MNLSWARESGSSGALAFAALMIAVVSGIALALPFDAHKAYDSVAVLLLTSPGGRFFRNVHYWSAQLFLILLTVHTWRHLARSSERKLSTGKWARIALLLPLSGFLMLSGFVLKGDAEGLQALRIVRTSVEQVPLAGELFAIALFGPDPASLQVVYVHHIATATLFTWLLVSEHARAIWPRLFSVVPTAGLSTLAALLAAPALHDVLNPLLKGPWYFVGLQEVFHHATRPGFVLAALMLPLAVVIAVARLPETMAHRAKVGLLGLAIGYGLVTIGALFLRGQNWTLQRPTLAAATGVLLESPLRVPPLGAIRGKTVPVVLGRREGCLFCHAATTALSPSHRPEAVGCSSCHVGNPFSLDKAIAHRGIVVIPGNLESAARTCGGTACHSAIVERVDRSIMTTMSGVISVDRATFGETGGSPHATPAMLGASPADTHLRQLCVSCHLGTAKRTLGPIREDSRGGGCNACHLVYDRPASEWLAAYVRDRRALSAGTGRMVHPDLSVRVSDDHCFGCHSRSGRISTSYQGWQEKSPDTPAPRDRATRTLADERVFVREQSDVHSEKGLLCVDCHTSREVMGDGVQHARKDGQVSVACEDCHATRPASVAHERADAESRRILTLLGRFQEGRSVLVTHKNGEALTSTTVDANGRAQLVAKRSGARMELKPPAEACVAGRAHARLSCTACHTAWAPRCSTCHTSFDPGAPGFDHLLQRDVRGSWVEIGAGFEARPPTLGMRVVTETDGRRRNLVDTFVPGMVLTINGAGGAERGGAMLFRRLYARTFSHTVSAHSRTCVSCHNDPVALGYGRGTLTYERSKTGGRWHFVPAEPLSPFDGLPNDAWIGLLEDAAGSRSTREDVRPFSAGEQKRILTAGACLTCHAPDSAVMRRSLADFDGVLRSATPSCVLPAWADR